MSIQKLKTDLEEFQEKIEKDPIINIDELIPKLSMIEEFLAKADKTKLKKEEVAEFLKEAKEVYLNQKEKMSKKESDLFRLYLNFIIYSLGYLPINENGNPLSEEDLKNGM